MKYNGSFRSAHNITGKKIDEMPSQTGSLVCWSTKREVGGNRGAFTLVYQQLHGKIVFLGWAKKRYHNSSCDNNATLYDAVLTREKHDYQIRISRNVEKPEDLEHQKNTTQEENKITKNMRQKKGNSSVLNFETLNIE